MEPQPPIRSIVDVLLAVLYPPTCPGCDRTLPGWGPACFCRRCAGSLGRIASPCAVCAEPGAAPICDTCQERPPVFRRAIACGPYRDGHPLAHALQRWKYRSDAQAGVVLLQHFVDRLASSSLHYDMVVPVPLHPWKLRSRGFNQAGELAHRLAHARPETGGFRRDILSRRWGAVQARLTRLRRIRNAESTFYVRREISGAAVLLVDDVLTSGATANACARVLLRAGAASVDVVVLARAGRTR